MIESNGSVVQGMVIRSPKGVDEFQVSQTGRSEEADRAHVELVAMHTMHDAAKPLDDESWCRAVKWMGEVRGARISVVFGGSADGQTSPDCDGNGVDAAHRADGGALSPRDFVSQKKPQSLVERIACLGYYLAHHRETPHFTVKDIVQLNTEAAAHKFGNPSRDVDKADRQSGYLVTAGYGKKQVTPRGEMVVEALPDRGALKAVLSDTPFKSRRPRESASKKVQQSKGE
ncbi:hypothetical protein RI138_04830 [Streptomyces sp. C11-1]|uniref:Uncharacterized protein n=1 Tax=Streptomyces durocortorensis TaxID=2811104 RepID=A0ABY9VYU5_9ACTN|nr:hypothetical protein [Streptomyces durocortorensis]WNF26191.1 hypothetical protein RI138_04830 [Streptomyces durocortorensis]